MARIAFAEAPDAASPRRFLLTAPLWGMAAGGLLLADGELALLSRWAPSTLALVHVFTLGVLGNAMFGSLLQFLPAAAGARIGGGRIAAALLHAALNAGALLLVIGFHRSLSGLPTAAAALLAAAFALLAGMTLPGLWRSDGARALRAGIGSAIAAAAVTALLGIAMLLALGGHPGLPLQPWVDVHAAWGIGGWTLGLIGSVACVVMPMFQGTATPTTAVQVAWLAGLGAVLGGGTACYVVAGESALLHRGVALAGFALAATGLWLQWRAPRTRPAPLVGFWRAGLTALLLAALVLVGRGDAMLAGVLAVAIALPLLVVGMQLEIVAFIGWIELRRASPRGVRVPGVQTLLPDRDKRRVLAWQIAGALVLAAAVSWPQPWLARTAGALLVVAYGALFHALRGVARVSGGFVQSLESAP